MPAIRTYRQYNVSVEVTRYKKGNKTRRLEEVKEKIFQGEYKEESALFQSVPRVYNK